MNKPEGDITVAKAEGVVALEFSNQSFEDGIRDLSGKENW